MAASPAPPRSLLPLLLLALFVAAADATVAGSFNAEAVCLKTTDVKSCQLVVQTMPPNILAKPDARSVAEACMTTASLWTTQYTASAINALQECKESDKCLSSCVKTIAAMNEALKAPAGGGEEERLPAIHRHLTALLRGGANQPRPRPPLCKTCCDVETCPPTKLNVVTQFRRMWALLDFTDVVLEELYPEKGMATATTTTSPATGSTAENTYGDDAKSKATSSPKETSKTPLSPKETSPKETSEITSSPKEASETISSSKEYPKETSPKETSSKEAYPKETSKTTSSPKETSEMASSSKETSSKETYPKETFKTTSSPKESPKETKQTSETTLSPKESPKETKETSETASSSKETSPKETSKMPSSTKDTYAPAPPVTTYD